MSGLTNPTHLALIAMIALIVLGPKRLPELGRSLGSGLREFRDAISGSEQRREPAAIDATQDHSSP
jgi:sec-independent protein translocase protein TatA